MSLETIITNARKRVLSRVAAILDNGPTHARAVRRELIVETAGKGGDLDNALGDLVKAAMVAQEHRSTTERAYYAMCEEVLSEARLELGRRALKLAKEREAALAARRNGEAA